MLSQAFQEIYLFYLFLIIEMDLITMCLTLRIYLTFSIGILFYWHLESYGVNVMQVNFYIRGPHGAGKVFTEMFKDKVEKQWKFTYLIVEINSPSPAQLMLESYVPA